MKERLGETEKEKKDEGRRETKTEKETEEM